MYIYIYIYIYIHIYIYAYIIIIIITIHMSRYSYDNMGSTPSPRVAFGMLMLSCWTAPIGKTRLQLDRLDQRSVLQRGT